MNVGQEILVPLQNFQNRKFTLIKELQGQYFQANVKFWGDIDMVCLKFLKLQEVQDQVREFLDFSLKYQNSEYELNNPSLIIKFLDYFEYNNQYLVIAMEKFENDLESFLVQKSNQLTNQEKLNICLQITKPIQFLHQNHYIHRDIKPENYVQIGNIFKLVKFDLIKQTSINRMMTLNIGAPTFQAPKIIKNPYYTNKVDIWSLACVFYEIFNEKVLFESDDQKMIQNQSQILSKTNSINIYQEFKELLIQMVNINDDQRIDANQVLKQQQLILQIESQKSSQVDQNNSFINNVKQLQYKQDLQFQIIVNYQQGDIIQQRQIQDLQLNINDLYQQIDFLKYNQDFQLTTNNQIIQSLENSFSQSIQKFEEQLNRKVEQLLGVMKAEIMKQNTQQLTQNLKFSKIDDVDFKFRQQKQQIQSLINKNENNLKEQFKNFIQIQIQDMQQQNNVRIDNDFINIRNKFKQSFDDLNSEYQTEVSNFKNSINQQMTQNDEMMTLKLNQIITINEQLKKEISEQNSMILNLEEQIKLIKKEKIQLEKENLQLKEENEKEILLFQDNNINFQEQLDDFKKDYDSLKNFIKNQQLQEQFQETQMQILLHNVEHNQLNPKIEQLLVEIKDEYTKQLDNLSEQFLSKFQSQEKNFVETTKTQLNYIDGEFQLSKIRWNSQENNLNLIQKTIDCLKEQYEFLKQENINLKYYLNQYQPYIQQLINYSIQQLRTEVNLNIQEWIHNLMRKKSIYQIVLPFKRKNLKKCKKKYQINNRNEQKFY